MKITRTLALMVLIAPMAAAAQTPPQATVYRDTSGQFQQAIGTFCVPASDGSGCAGTATSPSTTQGKQESFALVSANAPAAAVTVYGGSYVAAQGCTTYGTVTIRYRGPDGATMLTLLTKTAADSGGGSLVTLGGNAVVDATVTGTTGCNVTLTRVPQ